MRSVLCRPKVSIHRCTLARVRALEDAFARERMRETATEAVKCCSVWFFAACFSKAGSASERSGFGAGAVMS